MDSLQRYWATVVEVWNTGVFGIDLGRILVAAGILLLCLFLRHVFVRVVSARLQAWAARSKSEIDETLVVALEQPLGLIPVTFGLYLAAEFLELDGDLEAFVDNILESLIIIVIFWGFYRLVDPLSFLLRNLERLFSPELVGWLLKAIKATFLFLGAVAVLETWGIEVAPILAGLGIFGIAVALGAQDLFKNLIAGLLIIAEQRFSAGEWIKVDGVVEGTVEKIGFRSTRINRFDQAPVHVPNAELSDGVVTNFSRMTHRRIYWMIGVEYRTTVAQLRRSPTLPRSPPSCASTASASPPSTSCCTASRPRPTGASGSRSRRPWLTRSKTSSRGPAAASPSRAGRSTSRPCRAAARSPSSRRRIGPPTPRAAKAPRAVQGS
jgi:MscS family membrane protein